MATPSSPQPVERLLRAANEHDRAAFLASFTEDGVVDDWGHEFAGAEAIEGWSQVSTDGDDTTVLAQVGGRGFNGPSHFTFRVRGDLVERMTIRQ